MIEERWTTEALLEQYAQIEDYARLRRMSHDVRANLNNILGYVSLMRMAIETNNFTLNERIEFLQTISDATEIIDSIMEATLKASQPA